MAKQQLTRVYRRPSRAAALLAADDAARELAAEGWVERGRVERRAGGLWNRIVAATGRMVMGWEVVVDYRRHDAA
jgi:hypothetical protein